MAGEPASGFDRVRVSLLGHLAKIKGAMTESDRPAAVSARLKNSVRVEMQANAVKEIKTRFTRDFFVVNILRDLFQQTPDMVYGVGSTGNPLAFEVSFWTMELCKDFMEA